MNLLCWRVWTWGRPNARGRERRVNLSFKKSCCVEESQLYIPAFSSDDDDVSLWATWWMSSALLLCLERTSQREDRFIITSLQSVMNAHFRLFRLIFHTLRLPEAPRTSSHVGMYSIYTQMWPRHTAAGTLGTQRAARVLAQTPWHGFNFT